MKKVLRLLALVIVFGAFAWWLFAGANRGWTKNSVPVKTVDAVTGIEGLTYRKQFIPGLDFLAAAIAAGILCFGASFLFRTKPTAGASNPQTTPK